MSKKRSKRMRRLRKVQKRQKHQKHQLFGSDTAHNLKQIVERVFEANLVREFGKLDIKVPFNIDTVLVRKMNKMFI